MGSLRVLGLDSGGGVGGLSWGGGESRENTRIPCDEYLTTLARGKLRVNKVV